MATAASPPTRRRRTKARGKGRRGRLLDEATAYARSVVAGDVVACKFVRQACERHLRDLKDGRRRGLRFDVRAADRAISFIRTLKHTKGAAAKGFFNLRPWQAFVVGSIFGWRRANGLRRFSTAYIEIPRKNGKSELAGAIALYAAFFDAPVEFGAEAYVAATKRDQARIVFNVAKSMLRRAPAHRRRVRLLAQRLVRDDTESFLAPLGADADTMDGLNPAVVVIDELHAHRSPAVVNVMESATGARAQPLQIEITTAGADQQSVCFQHHEFSEQVLDPLSKVVDDAWFAVIYTTDAGDEWDDETAWRKANPNVDVSVPLEWIARRAKRSHEIRSSKTEFLQKVLNQWVNVGERAIQFDRWDLGAEPFDVAELAGRECWIGMDLARVKDLSAVVAVFPPKAPGEKWKVLCRFYCPEANIRERSQVDRVAYDQWEADGFLTATPGDSIDEDFILEDVIKWAKTFNVRELVYDEVFAARLIDRLTKEGLVCVPQSQRAVQMILPTAEFLRRYESGTLQHAGHPVLRWMAGNLVVRRGQTGDTAPDKKKSRDKIDGIVALIMAVGRANLAPPTIDFRPNILSISI